MSDATQPQKLLKLALAVFGVIFLFVYPLAVVWPSGWAWQPGPPHASQYFMMIVGVYATLGLFLIRASRDPGANLSLIWFTCGRAWSTPRSWPCSRSATATTRAICSATFRLSCWSPSSSVD